MHIVRNASSRRPNSNKQVSRFFYWSCCLHTLRMQAVQTWKTEPQWPCPNFKRKIFYKTVQINRKQNSTRAQFWHLSQQFCKNNPGFVWAYLWIKKWAFLYDRNPAFEKFRCFLEKFSCKLLGKVGPSNIPWGFKRDKTWDFGHSKIKGRWVHFKKVLIKNWHRNIDIKVVEKLNSQQRG